MHYSCHIIRCDGLWCLWEAHHSSLCMGSALESDILKMCGWIANYDHSERWQVESKIQLQHVYPRFPKKRELSTFGVLHD
jgi:hypothetical protein